MHTAVMFVAIASLFVMMMSRPISSFPLSLQKQTFVRKEMIQLQHPQQLHQRSFTSLLGMNSATSTSTSTSEAITIESELRAAAMKLHTTQQAPKEGGVVEVETRREYEYVTTMDDYVAFLVDSQHVYRALEAAVQSQPCLSSLRDTGLERTHALDMDLAYLKDTYDVTIPSVGALGRRYADEIRRTVGLVVDVDDEKDETNTDTNTTLNIPAFLCHFYNFYFAHTAGGRMIGKQMSALLLEKKTLEFYKWDGNLNEIKARVKGLIESIATEWTPEERKACVDTTAAAFRGGGGINMYLMGAAPKE